MRRLLLSILGLVVLGSCVHGRGEGGAPAPEIRVEFQAESAADRDAKASLVLSSPRGAPVWAAQWPTPDGKGIRSSFPFEGPGEYALRASFAHAPPVQVSVPVRRPDDVVDLKVLLQKDVVGRVWAEPDADLHLEVLTAPASGQPSQYRVTNASEVALPSTPILWPEVLGPALASSPRPVPASSAPGLLERVRLCPGAFATLWGESRPRFPAHASVTLDEATHACAFRALPPGDYAQLVLLDERTPIPRTVELRVPFRVTAETPLPPPRHVFADVPLAELEARAKAGERILEETDGGSVCVCEGALVGRQGLPVTERKAGALVLDADGGVPIQLLTNER